MKAEILRLFCLAGVIALTVLPARAETDSSGDWNVSISGSSATLAKYIGSSTSVTVPSSVSVPRQESYYDEDDGKTKTRTVHKSFNVTSLGTSLFANNTTVRSVSLGKFTAVPNSCFRNCTALTSAGLDFTKLTSVGSYAFENCAALTGAVDLQNATSIGSCAFGNCTGIASVRTYPACTSLGSSAFTGCSSLETAEIDGTGLDLSGCSRIFGGCGSLRSVMVGDGVVKLRAGLTNIYGSTWNEMFYDCGMLESVVLGTGVTNIPERCFYALRTLRMVEIRAPSVSVGNYAFRNCTALTSAGLDFTKLTSVGSYAFENCAALTGAVDLRNATSVGSYAFAGCTGLTSVRTYPACKSLGLGVFNGCSSLETAEIDGTGLDLGSSQHLFENCASLRSVMFGDGVVGLYTGYFNSHSGTFYGCTNLESVVFGSGIKSIPPYFCVTGGNPSKLRTVEFRAPSVSVGNYAFRNCTALTSTGLDFTKLTSVGSSAFSGCTNICGKVNLASATSIGSSAFYGCNGIASVEFGPELASIGSSAFANCTKAMSYLFRGTVPTVSSSPFGSSIGARGYYLPAYGEEWKAVIPASGVWNNLIMAGALQPKLTIVSADIHAGSLTLDWSSTGDGIAVDWPCELWRGVTPDFNAATNLISGGTSATSFVDTGFDAVEPRTSPLYYWVVPVNAETPYVPSGPVVARKRFGLSVGYFDYAPTVNKDYKPLAQSYNDAELFHWLCVEKGSFDRDNTHFLSNGGARTEDIRDEMARLADLANPGDTFAFYIATHGKSYYEVSGDAGVSQIRTAHLVSYSGGYDISELQNDIRKFPASTKVACFIMACHSGSMTGKPQEIEKPNEKWKEEVNQWLSKTGFDNPPDNVAWVVSCRDEQSSATAGIYSLFGKAFLADGWKDGYADSELINVENGIGGNGDGVVTFLQLARYASVFARGTWIKKEGVFFDEEFENVQDVQIENGGLLESIIAGTCPAPTPVKPGTPTILSVETIGIADQKITWQPAVHATGYRIYRTSASPNPVRECLAHSWEEGTSFTDGEAMLTGQYTYEVQGYNPGGFGDCSAGVGVALSEPLKDLFRSFLELYVKTLVPGVSTPEEYEGARHSKAANGMTYEACFVAGLDPERADAKLVSKITLKDGAPKITWEPALNGEGVKTGIRTYRVFGCRELGDTWCEVTDGDEAEYRFFKTTVELP